MDLESVYLVSQTVAGIAVVGSLLYVGVQLRQNTRAIRAAAVQSATETVATNASNIAATPENALLFNKGLENFASLTQSERAQFTQLMSAIFLSVDSMYWLYRDGSFPEEIWRREETGMRMWLASEGGRAAWKRLAVSESFRDHAEKHLLQPGPSKADV